MSLIKHRRPIEFQQLCAIAQRVLNADPTLDDAGWKGATLETVARQGWEEPGSSLLARALDAAEAALEKTRGPRPAGYLEIISRASR